MSATSISPQLYVPLKLVKTYALVSQGGGIDSVLQAATAVKMKVNSQAQKSSKSKDKKAIHVKSQGANDGSSDCVVYGVHSLVSGLDRVRK